MELFWVGLGPKKALCEDNCNIFTNYMPFQTPNQGKSPTSLIIPGSTNGLQTKGHRIIYSSSRTPLPIEHNKLTTMASALLTHFTHTPHTGHQRSPEKNLRGLLQRFLLAGALSNTKPTVSEQYSHTLQEATETSWES